MNTEQIKELVLRRHNMDGGFTPSEAAQIIDFIAKTYSEPTAAELKLHDQIEVLYPDIWYMATGDRNRKKKQVPELFRISNALLVKLCSLVVHYEEWTSNTGHSLDKAAIDTLMNDEEVVVLFKQMKELGLLPVKR